MNQHNRWINILKILTRPLNFLHYINSTYTTSFCSILTKGHITEAAEIDTTSLDEHGRDLHTTHITMCIIPSQHICLKYALRWIRFSGLLLVYGWHQHFIAVSIFSQKEKKNIFFTKRYLLNFQYDSMHICKPTFVNFYESSRSKKIQMV